MSPKLAKTDITNTLTAEGGTAMTIPHHIPEKKFVLCISGMAGCGKSTLAKRIAKEYRLRYFSGGDALKALASKAGYKTMKKGWWESREGMRFLKKRMQDSSFDKKIDEKLLEWAKQGNVVLDSWAMPWLLKTGFKIWLEASPEKRAQRIAQRDGISIKKALVALKEKDTKTYAIYKKLYGFDLGKDFSPFDLVLDVNQLSAEEVFHTINLLVNHLFIGI
ncbi:MAG: (d)CMP kinase [Candidatus Bathyarchaeia archaeon]